MVKGKVQTIINHKLINVWNSEHLEHRKLLNESEFAELRVPKTPQTAK